MTQPNENSMRIYLPKEEFMVFEDFLTSEQRWSLESVMEDGIMNYFIPGVDIVFCLKELRKDE